MPETQTESFCERCGTRYEFAAPTRLNPLRRGRGLVTGLKNYIMSQDDLADSVGDAMRSESEALAAIQLDAFHSAFNFCIDCRQYTCTNCWNDAAGRCRSCAPVAGTDDLIERFEASFAAQHPATVGAVDEAVVEADASDIGRRLGIDSWPTSDLAVPPTNGHVPLDWPPEVLAAEHAHDPMAAEPEPEPVAAEFTPEFVPEPEPERVAAEFTPEFVPEPEPEPVAAEFTPEFVPEPEPEPVAAEFTPEFVPEPEPEPVAAEFTPEFVPEPEPEPVAAEFTPPHPVVLHWEEDAPFRLLPAPEPVILEGVSAEPEPVAAEVAPEPEPEPVAAEVAPEPEPEPVAAEVAPEPEPEPVAAEVAPEPEPPRPSIRPIGDTILRLPRPTPSTPRHVEAPQAAEDPLAAARRAQMELLGLDDPGEGAVRPDRPRSLPYRSSGAAVPQGELAARAARAHGASAFWDASAREVADAVTHVGVQNCGQCGLSLSASARFCRRCGTQQARSA